MFNETNNEQSVYLVINVDLSQWARGMSRKVFLGGKLTIICTWMII